MAILSFILFLIRMYIFVLVIYALLSWMPWSYNSRFGQFISHLAEPYLRLFAKIPLNIGMIDFTVIVAIIVLELISKIIIGLF